MKIKTKTALQQPPTHQTILHQQKQPNTSQTNSQTAAIMDEK